MRGGKARSAGSSGARRWLRRRWAKLHVKALLAPTPHQAMCKHLVPRARRSVGALLATVHMLASRMLAYSDRWPIEVLQLLNTVLQARDRGNSRRLQAPPGWPMTEVRARSLRGLDPVQQASHVPDRCVDTAVSAMSAGQRPATRPLFVSWLLHALLAIAGACVARGGLCEMRPRPHAIFPRPCDLRRRPVQAQQRPPQRRPCPQPQQTSRAYGVSTAWRDVLKLQERRRH